MKDKLTNKSLTEDLSDRRPTFVCLCSGTGSNMLSILKSVKNQELKIKPLAIISDNAESKALITAKQWEIETFILSNSSVQERNESLSKELQRLNPDFIVLAGFIKKIPLDIIKTFKHKILNIHPSLLPKHGGKGMYGLKVHQSVIDAGDELTGATVHLVTENYDEGPIILQEKISVNKNETAEILAKKVLSIEHQIYPKAIKLYLDSIFNSVPHRNIVYKDINDDVIK